MRQIANIERLLKHVESLTQENRLFKIEIVISNHRSFTNW